MIVISDSYFRYSSSDVSDAERLHRESRRERLYHESRLEQRSSHLLAMRGAERLDEGLPPPVPHLPPDDRRGHPHPQGAGTYYIAHKVHEAKNKRDGR